jgi:NTP pyrophosphatase (non-canonical NTP hydrolase)
MTFNDYQEETNKTAIYPDRGNNFVYPVLGLMGEAGEVAEKIKKVWRDKNNIVSDNDKMEIKKEMGDVLWYLSQLATELEIDFEDVANTNILKINSRLERHKLNGDGDNR